MYTPVLLKRYLREMRFREWLQSGLASSTLENSPVKLAQNSHARSPHANRPSRARARGHFTRRILNECIERIENVPAEGAHAENKSETVGAYFAFDVPGREYFRRLMFARTNARAPRAPPAKPGNISESVEIAPRRKRTARRRPGSNERLTSAAKMNRALTYAPLEMKIVSPGRRERHTPSLPPRG